MIVETCDMSVLDPRGVDGQRDMRAGQLRNAGEKLRKYEFNCVKTFKARTSRIVKQCRREMLYLPGKKPRTITNQSIARVLTMFSSGMSYSQLDLNEFLYFVLM